MWESELMSQCPVCMYPELPYEPKDYHICPCCGTEFGNDDAFATHVQLRMAWVRAGTPWFFGNPPAGWNAIQQLMNAGLFWLPSNTSSPARGIIIESLGRITSMKVDAPGNSVELELQPA